MSHCRSTDLVRLGAVTNTNYLSTVNPVVRPMPKIIMLNAVIVGLIDCKVDRQNHSQITFPTEIAMVDPIMKPQDVYPCRFGLLVGGGIIDYRRISETTMPGILAQSNDRLARVDVTISKEKPIDHQMTPVYFQEGITGEPCLPGLLSLENNRIL